MEKPNETRNRCNRLSPSCLFREGKRGKKADAAVAAIIRWKRGGDRCNLSVSERERSGGVWRFAGTFGTDTEADGVGCRRNLVAATNTPLRLPRALPGSLFVSFSIRHRLLPLLLSNRSSIRRFTLSPFPSRPVPVVLPLPRIREQPEIAATRTKN